MADTWLDVVTPKDALLVNCILPWLHKSKISTLVTAKKQTQTTEVLELLNISHLEIGGYGNTLQEKLVEEAKRIAGLVDLFGEAECPRTLWTHGGVDAIRTAFGLQIPVVYSNDTLHAIHVAKLVSPLVDYLIAPKPFGKSWSRFGIPKPRIKLYEGVEEVAWIKGVTPKPPREVEELSNQHQLILFRNVERKASYYQESELDTFKLVRELSKMAEIVYLPRYESERKELKGIKNIWIPEKAVIAYNLLPAIDLVVGSGGTICRESALFGIPTMSFHFWDVIAEYLDKKGFPMHYSTKMETILSWAKNALKRPDEYKADAVRLLSTLESPINLTVKYLRKCLSMKL